MRTGTMPRMQEQLLVAGGGIGGLAAALACARGGARVALYERARAFGEVGAGIQVGPNVTRVLHGWGLAQALAEVAAFPGRLRVRSAGSGRVLGSLRLGEAMRARYGAPYATVHRADLHALLLQALRRTDAVLHLESRVESLTLQPEGVRLHLAGGRQAEGGLLVGADGLWSAVRQAVLHDGPPRFTGHLALRALLPQAQLPLALRSQEVTAWLGPRMHLVQYPVRGGEWLNVVAFVHGEPPPEADPARPGGGRWDYETDAAPLHAAVRQACTPLRELVAAVPAWRLWVMLDRPPMRGPGEQAQGRVALVGDAAHPMRPYLAQGAGMAIEDAACLGTLLAAAQGDVPEVLQRYAMQRWRRNARVQARALRNGRIFHAQGVVRSGRDMAMRLLGEQLLDMPWLYAG